MDRAATIPTVVFMFIAAVVATDPRLAGAEDAPADPIVSVAPAEGEEMVAAQRHSWHGNLGAGGSLLLSGAAGQRWRLDAQASLLPGGRFGHWGFLLAARAVGRDPDVALFTVGVERQLAASRPRLAISGYVDVGVESAGSLPVVGAGSRTVLRMMGPLGVAVDTGAHLILDGFSSTRLMASASLLIVVAR
jgi:hypothetical protein